MTNSNGARQLLLALTRAVAAYKNAETLFFEGRKQHTASPAAILHAWRESNVPEPVTRQKYYSSTRAGTTLVRVESNIGFNGRDLTTIFIKNSEGVWDVYPTVACEVSAIFKRDQLLGTFPFLRFFSTLEYPYELSIDKAQTNEEQLVIKGRLGAKPPQCEEDIAHEFSYTIKTESAYVSSLYEKTFQGKSLELVLEHVEVDRPMDERLFQFANRQKMVILDMEQYMNIRMREWGCQMFS
jgi:hypothetical protein